MGGSPRIATDPTHLLDSQQINSWRDRRTHARERLVVAKAAHLDPLFVDVQSIGRVPRELSNPDSRVDTVLILVGGQRCDKCVQIRAWDAPELGGLDH